MKKKCILINIFIINLILIVFFVCSFYVKVNNGVNLKIVIMLGMAINIYCIISGYNIKKKFTSIYVLFQIFSLLFLYGCLFSKYLLEYSVKDIYDLSILVNKESIINSCFLIIICQVGMHIGFLVANLKLIKDKEKSKKIYEGIELKSLKQLGWILLAISFIPAISYFYNKFKISAIKGYAGLSEITTYGTESIYSKIIPFFQIGLMLLMVGFKKQRKISRIILLFSVFFYGIQMFFGNRGIPLIAVITFIWLYHNSVEKLNNKIIIFICILIIPTSSVLNVIRLNRSKYGLEEWVYRFDDLIVENIKENNPIVETLYEIGTTIYPISYTLEVIPQKTNFTYGKTYMLALCSPFIINTSSEINSFSYNMNISARISKMARCPFGGSFIQEAYANFGWFSPFFMAILGIFIEIFERKNVKSNIAFVLTGYFLNPFLWTIRNVLITLPREIIWYILPTYIIYKIIYNQNKRGDSINSEKSCKSINNCSNL